MKVKKPQQQCALLCTFLCLISTVRPTYLNFSNPFYIENRITKTLTFKTAVLLGEYILSMDLLMIESLDFKELVLNCYT